MAGILTPVVGVLATALVAWFVYSYRNKIIYELVSIDGEVSLKAGKIVGARDDVRSERITADRLKFTNEGYRTLRDVELHLPLRIEPVYVKVARVATLSAQAITTKWEAGIFKIVMPTLPSSETVTIELLTVGFNSAMTPELRGTGGQYKIVTQRSADIAKGVWRTLGWLFAWGLCVYLLIYGKP